MKKNNEEGLFRQVRPKILLIMKLTTAFLLMSFLSVSAATLGQRATIKVTNVTLKSVFKEVKQKMGYTFVYNEHDVNQVGKVTLDITTSDVKQVLDKCLENTALGYYIQGDVVVIQKRAEQIVRDVEKESFKITGLVQDKKKEPLPGVTVLLKGTSVGVATDKDGKFSLEVPQMDSVVLFFSFVGMKDKEIAIKKLEKEMKPLTVVMEEDEEELSEVVVTGMFNRRKEGFTGSAVSVKGEDLKKISTTNIAKALAAIDPSFRIMEDVLNGSNPNRLPDLRMRGQATLPGGSNAGASAEMVTLQGEYDTYPNKPLLIMDGFEIDLQTMVDMDPDRVESITLLKDAAATAIYGSRAANGVIVIESKVPKEGRLWVTYGGNFRVEIPDLSDYNLMNAEEKLRAEVLAGMYKGNGSIDVLQNYQDKLREVKRGVDTYWLDKPLRTAVQQRHTVTLEGG
ncbi:MAG: carboxypeptidase-like regulatory domain-containing protein, partial [Butyricimonas sp.]|nr:carboxypeptidase-like regulatory domain-containing protein [Butyricimonas sp.]